MKTKIATVVFLAGTVIGTSAFASRVEGNFLGTHSGNDSAAALLADFSLDVTQLARVNTPDTSNGGLSVSDLTLNDDNEPTSGEWDYTGIGTVDYFVVKAGNSYAVYEYNDVITSNMPNLGLWDTSDLSNKGMSHVTAYQAVPEPTSAGLLILGAMGVLGRRGRRK